MPYTPTTWTDEVPASTPVKYTISQTAPGDIAASAEIALFTSVTAGTPVNAVNMNKIEAGVQTAQLTAENAATNSIPKSLVTTVGDFIYATASATLARLGKPTVDSILKNTSTGTPSWKAITDLLTVVSRQGGSASDWNTGGNSNYTPAIPKIQCGSKLLVFSSATSSTATVTLPASFTNKPLVLLTFDSSLIGGGVPDYFLTSYTITNSSFVIQLKFTVSRTASFPINWLAIGE